MSLHSPRLAPSCASLAPNVTPHAAAQMFHMKHSRGNSAKHGSPPSPAGARRGAARRWSPRAHRSGGNNETAAFLPPPPATRAPAPHVSCALRPRPSRFAHLASPPRAPRAPLRRLPLCASCVLAPLPLLASCTSLHRLRAPPHAPPRPLRPPPAQPVRLPHAPYAASHPCPRAPCAPLLPRPIASLALAPPRVFASPRVSRACPSAASRATGPRVSLPLAGASWKRCLSPLFWPAEHRVLRYA